MNRLIFDNLDEYEEQSDFRQDPFYKNVELKYSDISGIGGDRLRSKNYQSKKYSRPFTNVEIKNNEYGSGNNLKRKNNNNQINNHKFTVSSSGANIMKNRKY